MVSIMKTYNLEYSLNDSGVLETIQFEAEDEYQAEDLLEQHLKHADYDLISCELAD